MCFTAKLLMDCVLLLVLMPAALAFNTSTESRIGTESTPISTNPTPHIPTCEPTKTSKPNIVTLPPAVGRIKVTWKDKPCQGKMQFSINFTDTKYLCHGSSILEDKLGIDLCMERRCGEFFGFKKLDITTVEGYMIHKNLTVSRDSLCMRTVITCKDADKTELTAYKVITGLLLTLIIGVLLCRFVQPAYISVRKRFSQKRQNRWIGPTQSQSVSYHRGHPNNNTKRHSYPGLERLSVNPSREPSSNRNSDYESYGV